VEERGGGPGGGGGGGGGGQSTPRLYGRRTRRNCHTVQSICRANPHMLHTCQRGRSVHFGSGRAIATHACVCEYKKLYIPIDAQTHAGGYLHTCRLGQNARFISIYYICTNVYSRIFAHLPTWSKRTFRIGSRHRSEVKLSVCG